MGKYDLNNLVAKGPEIMKAAELTLEQWMLRVIKS